MSEFLRDTAHTVLGAMENEVEVTVWRVVSEDMGLELSTCYAKFKSRATCCTVVSCVFSSLYLHQVYFGSRVDGVFGMNLTAIFVQRLCVCSVFSVCRIRFLK